MPKVRKLFGTVPIQVHGEGGTITVTVVKGYNGTRDQLTFKGNGWEKTVSRGDWKNVPTTFKLHKRSRKP